MKSAYLQKISILLQFGGETLALLFPGESIQIHLILSQFQTLDNVKLVQFLLHQINVLLCQKVIHIPFITLIFFFAPDNSLFLCAYYRSKYLYAGKRMMGAIM